jgi:hypothetical protein
MNFDKACEKDEMKSGVSLTHNWGNSWAYDNIGGSNNPCSDKYRGKAAWSEHEVLGLRNLVSFEDISLYISYGAGRHSSYIIPYSYSMSATNPDKPEVTTQIKKLEHIIPSMYKLGKSE